MPSFQVNVPHKLTQAEAVSRLKGFLDRVRSHYGDQVSDLASNWEGSLLNFSFTTYTFKISGKLDVGQEAACVSGELPLVAMMFKGKIEQSLAGELSRAFGAEIV